LKLVLQTVLRAIAMAWLLVAIAVAAHGHAVVVETVPADGALLDTAPKVVVIRFNEPVTPVAAQVLNAAGDVMTPADAARVQGDELRIALPSRMAQGSYIASYRVISADSHPVGGSIVFSVGRVSDRMAAPMGAANDRGWTAAMVIIRAILYAGILGGAGGVLFLLVVGPIGEAARVTGRIAAVMAATGSLAALIAIGVQGGLLIGGPVTTLADAATWRLGLTSGFGTTAVVAVAGLALVAAGLGLGRPAVRPLAYAGAAAALAGLALSGHVVTAASRWITVPVLLTHVTAAAFWIGSLLPLHQAVARSGAKAAPVVQRFSRVAVRAVAALAVAGLIIVLLQVQSFGALVTTTYGLFLLAKLALVAGLLSLAVLNKMRLTPALAGGDPRAATSLRRSIAAELVFVLAILVATAALSTSPPPRVLEGVDETHAGHIHAAHEAQTREVSVTIIDAGRSVEVVLASDRSGINGAQITLQDSAGSPLQAQEVTFIAANPSAGVEPIRRQAEATGPGTWQVEHLLLVPSGLWSIRIDALISDFEKLGFETVVDLQ
jgi:copper transport protein